MAIIYRSCEPQQTMPLPHRCTIDCRTGSWPASSATRTRLHKGSDTAVKILEAARQQGKYWEALEKTMAAQPQWAAHHNPQPEMIWELIGDLGLDIAKAKAAAASPEIDQLLRQDVADMQALKVDRTPGFFVNGTPLREFGETQLKALVAQELAKPRPKS
jgi:protein-disulfide isomerase